MVLFLTTWALAQDRDGDGVPDGVDDCPDLADPQQGRPYLDGSVLATRNGPWELAHGDLDGDGRDDVVSCSLDGLGFHRNTGGAFAPTVDLGTEGCISLVVHDLDGDLDLDVVSSCGSASNEVCVHTNLGAGVFGAPQSLATGGYVYGMTAGDLDGDGDVDIAVADYVLDRVSWLENGGGSFSGLQPLASVNSAAWLGTGDLDGDGDVDLVYAGAFFRENRVGWFPNLGGGIGPERPIASDTNDLDGAALADLDGDGDLDVIVATSEEARVVWYPNDGTGVFGGREVAATFDGARVAEGADVDGDGDVDLLVGSGAVDSLTYVLTGEVGWAENLGGASFGPVDVFAGWTGRVRAVIPVDADGDGDLDVVAGVTETDELWVYDQLDPLPDLDDDGVCDASDADVDGDGADAASDCDDRDPTRYPGAPEVAGDSVDQDCDGRDDPVSHTGETGHSGGATGDDDDDDPPTGDDDDVTGDDDDDLPPESDDDDDGGVEEKGCGCDGSGSAPTWIGVVLMGVVRLRRR